jgi:hypothetical protein
VTHSVFIYTSIAANYLPKARVLAASVKQVAPQVRMVGMIVDDLPTDFNLANEPFDELIALQDLPLENPRAWAFGLRVVELCTAVKGMAAEYLFEHRGADKVFYFDPDMAVFARLDELINELDTASILLTPHQTTPESTVDAIMDNEMASLKHGVFNLGFVGIANTAQGRAFSGWWAERLKTFCLDDIPRGLFTDQKWANLIPCFFEDYKVLRSPAFNVATWNISTRAVTGSRNEGILVNGEPLGFYHFSGFDSGDQERMLTKYGADSAALQELRTWYIAECDRLGQQGKTPEYGYAYYDDGQRITPAQRALYRQRIDLQQAFPDPFSTQNKGGYLAWYRQHMPEDDASGQYVLDQHTSVKQGLLAVSNWLSQRAALQTGRLRRIVLRVAAKALQLPTYLLKA